MASLTAIHGAAAKVRYLRAIVAPSPEYLKARGWSRGFHIKRAFNRLGLRSDPALEQLKVTEVEIPRRHL